MFGIHLWRCERWHSASTLHVNFAQLLTLIAAILHSTVHTYIVVPVDQICVPRHSDMNRVQSIIRLMGNGTKSAALLELNQDHRHSLRCSVEIFGPSGYIVAVHFTPRSGIENKHYSSQTVELLSEQECLLSVDSSGRETTWQTDLCTYSDVSFSELLYRQSLRLSWTLPANKSFKKLRFSHIVLTMVARGVRKCEHVGRFPCWKHAKYSVFCIAAEFACDGHVNCPREGLDEDNDVCLEKDLKRDLMDGNSIDTNKDSEQVSEAEEDSLTKALTRYGPWGYLMLGTLICGALLMLCGLWECCCRPHKTSAPASTTPPDTTTVFIISGQQTNEELQSPPDAAVAPPTYEELDQPPDYNSLFPQKKTEENSEQDRTQSYA